MAAQDTKTKDIHHEDAVQTEAPNKGGVIETWKEAEKSTPMEKMKVNSMPHESADEPAAVDDTEMIVTPTKTPEKINKDTFKNAKEEFTRQKHKSGGEGRVGKVGSAASKLKDQAGEVSSIIFFIHLFESSVDYFRYNRSVYYEYNILFGAAGSCSCWWVAAWA